MKRTLRLTSPLMRGADVAYARRVLDLPDVGPWNEECAAAVRQAKFELGYPLKLVNGAFGTTLEEYLRGDRKPPLLYRRRATKRAEVDVGARALEEARKWLGTTEHPASSNIAKPFTPWYGWHGWGAPWCAVFVSYCLDKAGFEPVEPNAARWAYCPYFLRDARERRHGLRVVSSLEARPGDVVLFDWDGDGVADHIGFLRSKLPGATRFETVEGNTAFGNDSNGGKVMERVRFYSQAVAFVRCGR